MAPSSNVLGLVTERAGLKLHLYYLEELGDMKLRVTHVQNILLHAEYLEDIRLGAG